MGKAMADAQVIYKDIFEQKGPLLYVIYMISSYIIEGEYRSVFLLEVIFDAIGLFYVYKTAKLYVDDDKRYKIITSLFWIFIVCSKAFVYGDSAEEIWFALMTIIFFEGIYKKEYKNTIINCVSFLIGMLIPFAITNIYMFIKDALIDFYEKRNIYLFKAKEEPV